MGGFFGGAGSKSAKNTSYDQSSKKLTDYFLWFLWNCHTSSLWPKFYRFIKFTIACTQFEWYTKV